MLICCLFPIQFTATFLNGPKVTDCVIACPSYFDDAQRRALMTAAKLAELKVLRLLEESTAIALNYGILRNLPENEKQRVVFVDFGYASTQVAIVDFIRGKLSVRYKAANPFIGGRNIDRAIYETFRRQWLEKHKENVDDLPKQKLKLMQAAKKIKKLLTGNKDAVWTLDCFHNVCSLCYSLNVLCCVLSMVQNQKFLEIQWFQSIS